MRTRAYEALILLARDVGEADRFCVFFTREAGKQAARARGVRKLGSRIGGILLPLRHVRLEARESAAGWQITSASDCGAPDAFSFLSFSRFSEGLELLLRLTEDDEALTGVFDLLLAFRDACVRELPDPVLPFEYKLLHLLGFLPVTTEDTRFRTLSSLGRAFVHSCAADRLSFGELCVLPHGSGELRVFRNALLHDHLTRPLAAPGVTERLGR